MVSGPTLAGVAAQLNRQNGRGPGLPPLLLLTDETRLADPLPAARALPPGSGILLRHYDDTGRRSLAAALARLSRRRRLVLLIAARDRTDVRLARRIGAAGVHVPEALVHCLPAWRRLGGFRWMTAAAHGAAALHRAARAGADAALLSPVFATASHPGAPFIGPLRFARWARQSPVAVYGLGGITDKTARRLRASCAVGLAAIGGLTPAPAPVEPV
jgi:thiamine-phosphate pyrophosphorylase